VSGARQLLEHGRAGDDPAFYFREYAAPFGCRRGVLGGGGS
jgi:hypothetical protein